MAYSNYYLNMRVSNLQYQINQLEISSGSGLTLSQVHSSTLPFTATQTFNSGVNLNSLASTSPLTITNSAGGSLLLTDSLTVTGPSFFNDLITGTITNAQTATTAQTSITSNSSIYSVSSGSSLYSVSSGSSINSQNAANSILTTTSQNSSFYIPFVQNTSPSNLNINTALSVNPSTSTITASTFNGNLTGNASSSTAASTIAMTLTTANSNLPLLIGSSVSPGNISILTDVGLTVNPTTNLINGTISNSNNATNSQNLLIGTALPATTSNLYLTLSGNNNSTYNLLQGAAALRFQPSTGILSTAAISASSFILSPLYNTTNGGSVRLTGATGQYSQLQQSATGFGYDLNMILPSQGALNITTGGFNYVVPSGPDTSTAGLGIGWNSTTGGVRLIL